MSFPLSTTFAGLHLNSPIIIGSCPMAAGELQRIALVSNGAGAIVLPSLFEEHLIAPRNDTNGFRTDLDQYLELVESATANATIPIIASINGCSSTDWKNTLSQIESAGADAIELSLRPNLDSAPPDPRDLETSIVDATARIRSEINIPLIVKVTRNFTSISNLANRLRQHVDGVTLYGRAPVIDIELDSLERSRKWGMTESGTVLSSLEPIMQVRNQFPDLSIAASGGIGTSIDLIKSLLAGANVAMITSAVYRDGAPAIGSLMQGLSHFMEMHDMHCLSEVGVHSLSSREEALGFWQEGVEDDDASTALHAAKPAFVSDRYGHAKASEQPN